MHTFLNGGGLNPPNPPLATPLERLNPTECAQNIAADEIWANFSWVKLSWDARYDRAAAP